MERRRQIGKLVEVLEIVERAVAALIVEVAHIGRAIHRHEHAVRPADADAARRVAGVERELRRDGRHQLQEERTVDPDPMAAHIRTRPAPHARRFIVAEVDAHFLQDLHRLLVNELDGFRGHQLIDRNFAGQSRQGGDGRRALHQPGLATASPSARRAHLLRQLFDIDHGPEPSTAGPLRNSQSIRHRIASANSPIGN
jgi:hypothetical protein